MGTNAKSFAARLRQIGKDLPKQVFLPQRIEIVLDLLTSLVLNTPADEGDARRAWHISIGSPTNADSGSPDPVAAGANALAGASDIQDEIWIQNHVGPEVPGIGSRILILEHGLFEPANPGPSKDPRPARTGRTLVVGGYSVQAPQGITKDALQSVRAKHGLPSS